MCVCSLTGLLQEVVGERLEGCLLGAVVSVDGAGAAHGGDAALFGLLVDDAHERIHDEVVAELSSQLSALAKHR